MLRSAGRVFRQVYVCCCTVEGHGVKLATGQDMSPLWRRQFHQTPVYRVLSKGLVGNKSVIEVARKEKQENLETQDYDMDLVGLTEAGVTIPTLETHAMLIDGVRYDELPIIHIKSSANNTIILCTDHTGDEKLARASCGSEGFKNVKKSTNVAAQATGLALGTKALKKGVKNVRVCVKGLGAGRLPSIKGLQMAGLNIVSLTDRTPIPHNGPRPRKAKRL